MLMSEVTQEAIQKTVRDALSNDADPEIVSMFVAQVDWSGDAGPKVRALLGLLDGWTADYVEGRMSRDRYVAHLLSLLPCTSQYYNVKLVQRPQRLRLTPQMESGPRVGPVQVVGRNSTVPAA